MLANKSEKTIKLKWDGNIVEIGPRRTFNVGDLFDIKTSEVSFLEARFMQKHPELSRIGEAATLQPAPAQPPIEEAPKAPEGESEETPQHVDPYKPISLKDHTKAELLEMAAAVEIEASDKMTKAEIIALLEAKQKEE